MNDENMEISTIEEVIEQTVIPKFDPDMVKKYPKSCKKLIVDIAQYGITLEANEKPAGTTTFISPHGVEFKTTGEYPEGTLLRINVSIPNYWERKKQFIKYDRVDVPQNFRLLARVVSTESIGKRNKKSMVLCRTVNIEESDEKVLTSFLQEG